MMITSAVRMPDQTSSGAVVPSPPGGPLPPQETSWTKTRVIIAFWLLGMCNNYVYVIMLSAAHDVISKVEVGASDTSQFCTSCSP